MTDVAIKTQVMNTIKEALKTIPEVKTVERLPAKGIDLDICPKPAVFFYDEEEKCSKRGRLAQGEIALIVFAYIPLLMENYDNANDIADVVQGRIHATMALDLLTGNPLINNCQEGTVHKDYPNDEYLLLIMTFNVTYHHNWGDAFSNANY